jgi:hypothetical protein
MCTTRLESRVMRVNYVDSPVPRRDVPSIPARASTMDVERRRARAIADVGSIARLVETRRNTCATMFGTLFGTLVRLCAIFCVLTRL